MKTNRKTLMNKAISLVVVVLMIFSLCACSGGIKKDTLYEYTPSGPSISRAYIRAVMEDYSQIFTGSLLAYNPWSNVSVYSNTTNADGVPSGNGLYYYNETEQKNLSSTANRYSEASVTQSGFVYFEEKDTSAEYVYVTDMTGEKKTLLARSQAGNNLVWCVSEMNTFAYVDDKNNIVTVKENAEKVIYTFSPSFSVKKIRYCEADRLFVLIANNGGNSDVLYRLNLDDLAITAVDVNVTDMSVVTSADKTAYIKTNSQGQKQLYVYNHNTLARTYVMNGNIDKFALSPFGGYVAYVARTTDTGPTQSVWIVNCRDFTNVQVAASTNISGNIYWASSEKELLFTAAESSEQPVTTYKTYRIKFKFEYTEE